MEKEVEGKEGEVGEEEKQAVLEALGGKKEEEEREDEKGRLFA